MALNHINFKLLNIISAKFDGLEFHNTPQYMDSSPSIGPKLCSKAWIWLQLSNSPIITHEIAKIQKFGKTISLLSDLKNQTIVS